MCLPDSKPQFFPVLSSLSSASFPRRTFCWDARSRSLRTESPVNVRAEAILRAMSGRRAAHAGVGKEDGMKEPHPPGQLSVDLPCHFPLPQTWLSPTGYLPQKTGRLDKSDLRTSSGRNQCGRSVGRKLSEAGRQSVIAGSQGDSVQSQCGNKHG